LTSPHATLTLRKIPEGTQIKVDLPPNPKLAPGVRLWLSVLAYKLGNLWRRLVLPKKIENWHLTSLPAGWSSMPGTDEAPSFDTGKAKANDNPESTCTSGTHKLSRPTTKETKRSIIMTTVSDVNVSEINARRR
jgi:hypothetical protein